MKNNRIFRSIIVFAMIVAIGIILALFIGTTIHKNKRAKNNSKKSSPSNNNTNITTSQITDKRTFVEFADNELVSSLITELEKIKTLDNLGLSLYMLDDASRSDSNWELCVAMLTQEEKKYFLDICKDRFDINGYIQNYDNRYITFDAVSSRKIDDIILNVLPHNLDIITKKIYNHRKDLVNE